MSSPPTERKSIRLTADDMKAAEARNSSPRRPSSPLRGLSLGGSPPSSPLRGLSLGGSPPSSPRGMGGSRILPRPVTVSRPVGEMKRPFSSVSRPVGESKYSPSVSRPVGEMKRPFSSVSRPPLRSVRFGAETKGAPARSFSIARPVVGSSRPSIFVFNEDGTRSVDIARVDWDNLNQYNIIELRNIASTLGAEAPRWTDRETLIATIVSMVPS